MKDAPNHAAEKFRNHAASYGVVDSNNGAFEVPYGSKPHVKVLRVIVSDGGGWDHVSVSLANRTPTWEEMCYVKDLFFRSDEVVMQLHPAKSEYVNFHPHCLHLWRPQTEEERQVLVDEYLRDRPLMSEEMREELDRLELAPLPGPIPTPPSIMVGPRNNAAG